MRAPQEGFGGGTPSPRKLRLASDTIADPKYPVDSTKIGAMQLGSTWRSITRQVLAPRALVARTYTSSFTVRAEDLETRTMRGLMFTAMARVTLLMEAPRAMTSIMVNTREGNPMKASTTRWTSRSNRPPRYPDAMPMMVPTTDPRATERKPT